MVFFLNKLYPESAAEQEPADGSKFDIFDVNPTLNRILHVNLKTDVEIRLPEQSIWRPRPLTITGGSKLIVRTHFQNGAVLIRPVTGFECMNLIGWDVALWHPTAAKCTNDLMVNMSGNAFSAFAAGPVLISGLSLCGCPEVEDGENQNVDSSTEEMGL